jgi:hypothetical protein
MAAGNTGSHKMRSLCMLQMHFFGARSAEYFAFAISFCTFNKVFRLNQFSAFNIPHFVEPGNVSGKAYKTITMRRFLFQFLIILIAGSFTQAQNMTFSVSGKITDCKTHAYINGATLRLLGNDGSTVETISDKFGSYYFDSTKVKPGKQYVLGVQTSDNRHLNSTDKFKFETSEATNSFKYDFCLVPNRPCTLGTFRIYFVKNSFSKYEVDSLSMDLDSYVIFLNDSPTYKIEINSNSSFDEKQQDTLSKKRAEYLKKILIEKGINKERILIRSLGTKNNNKMLYIEIIGKDFPVKDKPITPKDTTDTE